MKVLTGESRIITDIWQALKDLQGLDVLDLEGNYKDTKS